MNNRIFTFFVLTAILQVSYSEIIFAERDSNALKHYYCTAADENYYTRLINLIGSIHQNDFENLGEIAVFDLGFNSEQIAKLKSIEKIEIYAVEKKHPDILVPFQTCHSGRLVKGWFAWKPVIIKQALDRFPYIVYLDAGTTILKPMTNLFKHIQQNGYFLIDTGHNIEQRITQPVIDKIVSHLSPDQQAMIMDKNTMELDGGFQGLSRAVYKDYVVPMYEYAADLSLFMDDGSCKMGLGAGRHDQILFSIVANLLKLNFYWQGWLNLKVDGKDVPLHFHWDKNEINEETTVYRSRSDTNLEYFEKCIHYKN